MKNKFFTVVVTYLLFSPLAQASHVQQLRFPEELDKCGIVRHRNSDPDAYFSLNYLKEYDDGSQVRQVLTLISTDDFVTKLLLKASTLDEELCFNGLRSLKNTPHMYIVDSEYRLGKL